MRLLARILGPMPFARLSATHTVCNFADSFFAVSLAGSLFFNVSVGAARPRVIAYLLVTLAPFLLLAPVVGPLIDRFARTEQASSRPRPCSGEGFCASSSRVTSRTCCSTRRCSASSSSTRPTPSRRARSCRGSSPTTAISSRRTRASPASPLLPACSAAPSRSGSSTRPTLRRCCGSRRCSTSPRPTSPCCIPADTTQPLPEPEVERVELRLSTVRAAAAAMGVLRGATGFLVFLVAFGLKRAAEPLWFFGAVAAASVAGSLLGTIVSPALRKRFSRTEPLFVFALVIAGVVSLVAALWSARAGDVAAVFAVALGANIGRQSFDSVLQRDAPDAAHGRAFAALRNALPADLGRRGAAGGRAAADPAPRARGPGLRLRADGCALRDVPQDRERHRRGRPGMPRPRRPTRARSVSIQREPLCGIGLGEVGVGAHGTGHRVEALLLRRPERRAFGRRTQIGGAAVRGDRIARVLEPEERGDLAEGAPFLAKGERLLVAPLFLVLLT